jgi:glycerophosphoryl diester phosphodiesterase
MNFDLRESARDHRLIVAHRGVAAGNIPCNTMTAYEIALKQGADMIETDLNQTADGELVIFHPGMEPAHLGVSGRIEKMTWEEVRQLRYVNYDHVPTQFGLVRFDDLLETFKNRCYINVDKFWGHPKEIYEAIKRHGMIDQVLVKSSLTNADRVLSVLEEVAPELPFIPVVKEAHPLHEALMKRNINYVGVEVLFEKDNSPLASEAFIEQMRKDGKLTWVNSIIYNTAAQLSGGHSDDTAFTESMEYGWGWLADRDFDLIQTDWPMMLIQFLKETGRYYR